MTINNIFSNKSLGIDVGRENTKLVLGKKTKNKLKLYSAMMIERDYLENQNFLLNLVFSNKSRYRKANLSLNLDEFDYEIFELPSLQNNELRLALESKYGAENFEKYLIQYLRYKGKEDRIFSLLIGQDRVNKYREKLRDLFLRPTSLSLNNTNFIKLINHSGLVNSSYKIRDKNIISIDLGYESLDITIFKNNSLLFTKSFNRGLVEFYRRAGSEVENVKDIRLYMEKIENIFKLNYDRFLDAEFLNYLDQLIDLIGINLNYFKDTFNDRLDLAILTGGLSSLNGVDNFFTNKLNLQTIVLKDLEGLELAGDNIPLNIYGNAIGSLINSKEVNYV